MKKRLVMFLSVFSLVWSRSVFAYDPRTHQDLSEAAVNASILRTDPSVLSHLGLASLDVPDQQFLNSEGRPGTITLLVQDGAAFEDNGTRPLNHFYNPLTNEPLVHVVCSLPLLSCSSSPDWALEEQTTYYEQGDSFRDTRQFLLNALTQQSKNAREEAWGRTFQGLGQIMHHLQDMAQPQHVRNDPHPESRFHIPGLENPSLYEHYTVQTVPDDVRDRIKASYFGGYAPVYSSDDPSTFNSPRKLWHTNDGKGIADYTNRGFVSAGTNFDQIAGPSIFHQPDITSGTVTIEDKTALCQEISERSGAPLPKDETGQTLPCLMVFVGTDVNDSYRPDQSGHNDKTSTYSIFDADLTKYFQIRLTTLNKFNFEAAYPFLMKRAVAYSAGLINYFFRGNIDLTPDDDPQNPGGYLIKNLGPEDLNGMFTLYYDDAEGNRYPVLGAAWPLLVAAGKAVAVSAFTPPTSPSPEIPGAYLLVFRGTMGEEQETDEAVGAVTAKTISTLSPFLLDTSAGVYRSQAQQFGYEWEAFPGWFGPQWIGTVLNAEWMLLDGEPFHYVDGQWEWVDLRTPELWNLWGIASLGGDELAGVACLSGSFECGFVYSADFGASWRFQSSYAAAGIQRDPYGVWYLGNGEIAMSSLDLSVGLYHVYRSTDRGVSWTQMPRPGAGGNSLDQWLVDAMWWNQREGEGRVSLATGVSGLYPSTFGLWKSTDGGQSWRLVWSHVAADETCRGDVHSLAISPDGRALMVVYDSCLGAWQLYWSIDAGESWTLGELPTVNGEASIPGGVMYLGPYLVTP